jgi:hypothetical protein
MVPGMRIELTTSERIGDNAHALDHSAILTHFTIWFNTYTLWNEVDRLFKKKTTGAQIQLFIKIYNYLTNIK